MLAPIGTSWLTGTGPAQRALAVHQQPPAQRVDGLGSGRSRGRRRTHPPDGVRAGRAELTIEDTGTSSGSGAPAATTSRPGAPWSSAVAAPSRWTLAVAAGSRNAMRAPPWPIRWRLVARLDALGLALGERAVDVLDLEADVEEAGALRWPSSPPLTPGFRGARRSRNRSRRPTTARKGRSGRSAAQARVLVSRRARQRRQRDGTSIAHQLGGGAATYAANPLLRTLGDVQASRQHLLFSTAPRGAREVLAGLDVDYPPGTSS